ncbi:proton-dependent oligopeptide transport family protein [Hibiscus syriacus]|uniref:Proton-dependent oligopeptide transport family protein n=1 Tax=Hibiscus syriacus TaxID=106335 RepID=A0A6A2YA68_HIBSY|nr:proton-dependent oligopeptide transport family protein [Hibiscus syriacus]
MDNRTPRNEGTGEVTRESLIQISYSLPDTVVASKPSSGILNGEKQIESIGSDGAEKYRSELISISYSQSPDDKGLPSPLKGLKN